MNVAADLPYQAVRKVREILDNFDVSHHKELVTLAYKEARRPSSEVLDHGINANLMLENFAKNKGTKFQFKGKAGAFLSPYFVEVKLHKLIYLRLLSCDFRQGKLVHTNQ